MNAVEQMAVDVFTEGANYAPNIILGACGERIRVGLCVQSDGGEYNITDYEMAMLSREAGWIIGDTIREQGAEDEQETEGALPD